MVLRSVIAASDVRAGMPGLELTRRRSITVSPGRGATTLLRDRPRAQPDHEPELAAV